MSEDKVTESFFQKVDVFTFGKISDDCQSIHDVIKEDILTNEGLQDAIVLLNENLINNSDNIIKLILPVVSVVIGVILGFLSNRIHWKLTEKDKKQRESLEKLSELIDDIEEISVEYWTKDNNDNDNKNEVYIKSKLRFIEKFVRIKIKDSKLKTELNDFVSDIYDLATGDDFESKKRKASKPKAISISYKCADINATVSSQI